jgi:hypothetical protein
VVWESTVGASPAVVTTCADPTQPSTRYSLALPGGDDGGAGQRNTTTPPPDGVVPPPLAGSAHLDDRAAQLIARERYLRNATGTLVARPPADIAYRLSAWYRVPGITTGQVADLLRGRPVKAELAPLCRIELTN